MKIKNIAFVIAIICFFIPGCSKENDHLAMPKCEVSQVTLEKMLPIHPYLFKKFYDPSDRFVKEIHLTFVWPGVMPMFQLLLKYESKKLLFINKNNLNDVVMKVDFNSKGRPHTIVTYETLYDVTTTTRFTYRHNRLDSVIKQSGSIQIHEKCYYDNAGNILAIKHFNNDYGEYDGSFYTYDYSRTTKEAFYQEEPRGFTSFGFAVLQYVHFFPELDPANVRTHSKVGPESGPYLQNRTLNNHLLDPDGKLVSYNELGAGTVSVQWKCGKSRTHP